MPVLTHITASIEPSLPQPREWVDCIVCNGYYHYTTVQTLENDHNIVDMCHHDAYKDGKLESKAYQNMIKEEANHE